VKRGLVLILVIALGAALWVTIAWVLFGPEEPEEVEPPSTAEPAREQPLDAAIVETLHRRPRGS
jgi:hypothetical protein